MKRSESDEPLAQVLRDWQLTPRPHPHFRTEVWRRIEAASKPVAWTAFARQHAGAVAGALVVAAVIGAVAGREQARTRVADDSAQLASAYVQSLDARTMRMP